MLVPVEGPSETIQPANLPRRAEGTVSPPMPPIAPWTIAHLRFRVLVVGSLDRAEFRDAAYWLYQHAALVVASSLDDAADRIRCLDPPPTLIVLAHGVSWAVCRRASGAGPTPGALDTCCRSAGQLVRGRNALAQRLRHGHAGLLAQLDTSRRIGLEETGCGEVPSVGIAGDGDGGRAMAGPHHPPAGGHVAVA